MRPDRGENAIARRGDRNREQPNPGRPQRAGRQPARIDSPAVEQRWPGPTARRMSMRETTVPKSFEVQRTKANVLPGANDSTRRLRPRILSSTARPKRIQFSMRFSSQRSSTCVRSLIDRLHRCPGRPRPGAEGIRSAACAQRPKRRGPLEEIRRISG